MGGDGWAYDIGGWRSRPRPGFGDERQRSGAGYGSLFEYGRPDVQGDTARRGGKIRHGGKHAGKKDLAMEAISYGSVYVARVAMGGSDTHTVKAFLKPRPTTGRR